MPLIEVSGLGKTVADAGATPGQAARPLDILHDIGFSLESGETAAIVVASGSGKSILLGLLAGLDLPSRGTVRVMGQDLAVLDEDGRAALRSRAIGFVFQSFHLLGHLTALENVMLALELRVPEAGQHKMSYAQARERAVALLERVGLGELSGPLSAHALGRRAAACGARPRLRH